MAYEAVAEKKNAIFGFIYWNIMSKMDEAVESY